MKLLVCCTEYYPYGSGIANVAYNVVQQLRQRDICCEVCSPIGPDIRLGSTSLIQRAGRVGLLHYWECVRQYFRRKVGVYDVAWLHYPLFIRPSFFAAAVATIHSTAYKQSRERLYGQAKYHLYYTMAARLERFSLLRLSDTTLFTGVSPDVCKTLEQMGIDPQSVVYIPNGVDTEQFKPAHNKKGLRSKFHLPEQATLLLSVGRMSVQKQPLRLIEAFARLSRLSDNLALAFAGDGELLEDARQLALRRGLDNVFFLGHVDHTNDLPDLYACADYYVMASVYEGQPLTLLEAMSSGLPCLVSDLPTLGIVQEAECGLVLDFARSEEAARAMAAFLTRDTSHEAKNARDYVVRNRGWDVVAQQYLERLERAVAAQHVGGP